MQTEFVFRITEMDTGALHPQVCRALEKRVELHSRQKCPALWRLTDRLRSVKKVPAPVRQRRRKRRTVLALVNWLLAIFALLPSLLSPGELWPVLLAGAVCFGVGVTVLWRNARRLLGVLQLTVGALLCLGGGANPEELGRLLPFGIVCFGIGAAAFLVRKRQPVSAFDREARRLLQGREHVDGQDKMQVRFTEAGMVFYQTETGTQSEPMAYPDFENLLETEDLLMVIYGDRALLLQKKDLQTGTMPELRAFLQARAPYVSALAEPVCETA